MSFTENPYAPPRANLEAPGARGLWREGDLVVMEVGADLPPRCVKCDAPAEQPVKPRTLYWHHPSLYILVFMALLLYAIVALLVRKQTTLSPGLCATHRKRRTYWITVACLGPVLGLGLLVTAEGSGAQVLLGLILLAASLIGGLLGARIVYPDRIDDHQVRLKGCGEAFLQGLPSRPT